jgi:hypothetical protein
MNPRTPVHFSLPHAAPSPWPRQPQETLPTQTRAWVEARIQALATPASLQLVTITEGEELQALAPLQRSGDWLREVPQMFEPTDLVYASEDALQALADALARQPYALHLERIPLGSPTVAALRRAFAGRGILRMREAMATPLIELDGRWEDIESRLPARRRADLRCAARLAERLGAVSYELHTPRDQQELDALLHTAYAVDNRSWKALENSALSTNRIQGDFFRRYTRAALPEGVLRFAFLRINGLPVAMQIGIVWHQRFWLLKMSYDRAFGRCSPGHLLIWHTLQQAARDRLLSYEFMGLIDDWVTHWTMTLRRYVEIRAFPLRIPALRAYTRSAAQNAYSRLRGRWR